MCGLSPEVRTPGKLSNIRVRGHESLWRLLSLFPPLLSALWRASPSLAPSCTHRANTHTTRALALSLLRHCHILFVLVRDSLVLLSLCTCVLFCARCELFRARCLCLELAASALFVITTKTRPPAYRCRALVVHTPFSTRRTVPRLRPTALRVFSR